uniref:PIPK domain-containing protein n=1 Tax=Proboscia inermis TaxID=420281 RepID=A0A7S0BY12_9STRA|mmetsp:Transcript_15585/g.15773  ORF Transcript_15585/g.15773 Transcript_15585/m.15773 type:complete len:227 (+) Transcript_15585:189-869(+)
MVNEVEFMRNNLLPLPREADDEKSQSHSSFATTKSYGIDIGPRLKADLLSQLRSDVSLLAECGVMDYSLLVGVVNLEESTYSIKANPFRYILSKKHKKQTGIQGKIIKLISFPMKTIIAPPLYLTSKLYTILGHTMSSILTLPLPYYGAGICGVDGGNLSILHGRRLGKRGVYYLGLIDFLQPWTTKKVLEREMWGLLGYDKSAVSCTDPEEYGERFIEFMSQIMI